MKLASISENLKNEKRISITPEIAKKYISLGFEIIVSKNYGSHLGFSDKEYSDLGVNTSSSDEEILKNADIIIQVGLPSDKNLEFFFGVVAKNYKSTINGCFIISS